MLKIITRSAVAATLLLVANSFIVLPTYAAQKSSNQAKQTKVQDDKELNAWQKLYRKNKAKLEEKRAERLAARKAGQNKVASKSASFKTASLQTDERAQVRDFSVRWTSGSSKNKKSPKAAKQSGVKGLIAKYAAQHGVPQNLARAVVQVESNFRPHVTGAAGEIGLMQIKLSTARGMGYKGSAKSLYDPSTNLFWGMKYLGRAHQLSGGTTCGTILKYNAGHYAKRSNPISSRYCRKVQQII